MSNKSKKQTATLDSVRYNKDCKDFICLNDGTIYRDHRYCDLSTKCRQVGLVLDNLVPMESHYCPIVNPITNETVEWEYYCTGMHDNRPLNERNEDEKIS